MHTKNISKLCKLKNLNEFLFWSGKVCAYSAYAMNKAIPHNEFQQVYESNEMKNPLHVAVGGFFVCLGSYNLSRILSEGERVNSSDENTER